VTAPKAAEVEAERREWSEVVEPLAARFEVAAKFGQSAVWNATGSAAMAKLMRNMARIIDDEIMARRAAHPSKGE
jgi:hypothetical protein